MIQFLIAMVIVQLLVYGAIYFAEYQYVTGSLVCRSDIEGFKKFNKDWKFWYFCVPFLPLFILIKRVRKKSKELLER